MRSEIPGISVQFFQVIAQSGLAASRNPLRIWIVVGMLIAAVVVLGLVILQMRKRLFRSDAPDESPAGVMEQIRGLHRSGAITDAEYDQLRKRLVAKVAERSTGELSIRGGVPGQSNRMQPREPGSPGPGKTSPGPGEGSE